MGGTRTFCHDPYLTNLRKVSRLLWKSYSTGEGQGKRKSSWKRGQTTKEKDFPDTYGPIVPRGLVSKSLAKFKKFCGTLRLWVHKNT